jgi:hypothetical protein
VVKLKKEKEFVTQSETFGGGQSMPPGRSKSSKRAGGEDDQFQILDNDELGFEGNDAYAEVD